MSSICKAYNRGETLAMGKPNERRVTADLRELGACNDATDDLVDSDDDLSSDDEETRMPEFEWRRRD